MKLASTFALFALCTSLAFAEEPTFQFYGFLKTDASVANQAVSSFGSATGTTVWNRENQVAATEAAPTGLGTGDSMARSAFSLSQSRFGFNAGVSPSLKGNFEFDLIDFDKALATVSIRPRLRVARILYSPTDKDQIVMGQDWDLTSGTKPFTYNFVELYFRAGNVGFMRPQITWTHLFGMIDTSLMVGSAGINDATSNDSALERGIAPVGAARVVLHFNPTSRMGVVAEGTARRFENGTDATNAVSRFAGVGEVFAEVAPFESLILKTNLYAGQNIQSLGSLLTLSSGSFASDLREAGGYLSGQWSFTDRHRIQLGGGFARILNLDDLGGLAIRSNAVYKAAYSFTPVEKLQLYAEYTHFVTDYRLGSGTAQMSEANIGELGAVLNF